MHTLQSTPLVRVNAVMMPGICTIKAAREAHDLHIDKNQ